MQVKSIKFTLVLFWTCVELFALYLGVDGIFFALIGRVEPATLLLSVPMFLLAIRCIWCDFKEATHD